VFLYVINTIITCVASLHLLTITFYEKCVLSLKCLLLCALKRWNETKIDMQRISPFSPTDNRVELLPVCSLMSFGGNVLVFGCNYRATQTTRQHRDRHMIIQGTMWLINTYKHTCWKPRNPLYDMMNNSLRMRVSAWRCHYRIDITRPWSNVWLMLVGKSSIKARIELYVLWISYWVI